LKILLNEFHRCSKGNISQFIPILKKFEMYVENYSDNSLFQRTFAMLYLELKDFASAIEHANVAVEIDKTNPVSKYVLAECFFSSKKYEESAKIYGDLIDAGWADPNKSDKRYPLSLYYGLFNSLLFDGKYKQLLERTQNWQQVERYRGVLGGYRATTYKRIIENSLDSNPTKYIEYLSKAIKTLDELFEIEGYAKNICNISWKYSLKLKRVVHLDYANNRILNISNIAVTFCINI
jgi:tetratricopeptide (TPR) repeat protein